MVQTWAFVILAVVAAQDDISSQRFWPGSHDRAADWIGQIADKVLRGMSGLGFGVLQCFQKQTSLITEDFIQTNLDGNPLFIREDMPFPQSQELLDTFTADLVNHRTSEDLVSAELFKTVLAMAGEGVRDLTFAEGPAAKVANQMFNATKVDGVFEKVPEKFRGVFWMKGNAVGEELAVLQYGKWFEEEQKLLVPMAPYMWGWPAGKPTDAPAGGLMYGDFTGGGALVLLKDGKKQAGTFSWIYGPCPSGKVCEEGSDDLTYAQLQAHVGGDLRKMSANIKDLFPFMPDIAEHVTGEFTLEEVPGSSGYKFFRRINWGLGSCHPAETGSYDLVKIIDSNGHPIEPEYSEFIKYMGDVPLYVWTGFTQPLV